MAVLLGICSLLLATFCPVLSDEVCYGDLGCFTNEPPYDNTPPAAFPPDSPEEQDIKYYLYTRRNRNIPTVLTRNDLGALLGSNFDPSKPSKFYIHGWNSQGRTGYSQSLCQEILIKDDVNAFAVDWRKGARGISYFIPAENSKVAGAEVAAFLQYLRDNTGASYKDMHVIGHSLGSQVAGYVGERTPGLGRITGLDPAQPYFEYKDPLVRLDPTDADFVDVIHTDGNNVLTLGFGLFQPSGDIDFYPNGGKKQPGCATFNNTDGQYHLSFGCDHSRAPYYFFESINSDCEFKAYPCDLWDIDYDPSKCNYCAHAECAVMGYNADNSDNPKGTFYLATNSDQPYCQD